MELAFNHLRAFGQAAATGDGAAPGPMPDWNGIKARFLAAHALRRELMLNANLMTAGGSFTAAGPGVLAANRHNMLCVNHTALANGKSPSATRAAFAGIPTPAGEE